ncbi:2-keto-4-pentenoate hydratase [Chelatococcus sp. GCM10030263]|uniref:2-keto-4-pentenoate hydratase n=1 Tax=Chelatococcus sp. GCM10030263 TaxID=3273387 RepID=UPI003605CB79
MQPTAIMTAANLLADARRQGRPLAALPDDVRPATFADAAAIQVATVRVLRDSVAGYKVAGSDPAEVMWGAVLRSRLKPAPAVFAATEVPLLGVEAEIAYRLEDDFTAADRSITLADFDRRVSVLPAIEVVDTRFTSYTDTPLLDRAADFMSNGGLVYGEPWADAASHDLVKLAITFRAGDTLLSDTVGGNAAGDPRLPALAFIQAPGRPDLLPRGTIITTGAYSGLQYAKAGDVVSAKFAGYGEITVTLSV